jgi:hypothetical protein
LLVGDAQEDLFVSERIVPRAPSRDGAVVAVPPLRDAGVVLATNRQRLHTHAAHRVLLGRPWHDLRRQARQSALAAAVRYLGDDAPSALGLSHSESLLVAGHQPELFHPGVWVKNFALAGLARAHQATALNLVVDNDTVKSTALHVPSPPMQTHDRPHRRSVLFDRWSGETP